jgi:hypothetical protein
MGDYLDGTKNLFQEFGNYALKIISDVIAQLITAWIWEKLVGVFSSVASVGTSNIASNSYATEGLSLGGFAEGTDSIPTTGNYRLHEGEKVTPKYDVTKSSGATEITIHNLITPEAVAMAMSGQEGKGVIVNVINTDALRNGTTRRTIKNK